MWPPQSVNTGPTPAPLSARPTSSPPVIQSEGAAPSDPPRLSSRQPPRFTDSPRGARRRASAAAARLALPHPHARLGRRGPSPATACGSHCHIHTLASAGGGPAPRRPAAPPPPPPKFSPLTGLPARPLADR